MIKYIRITLFYYFLKFFSPVTRGRRMKKLVEIFELQPGTRIIDLGGTSEIWNLVDIPLDITIVNLPGIDKHDDVQSRHRFTFVNGDATNLPDFGLNSFDLVFSNSVIEHVGGSTKERMFANEVRRLAPSYFVQTPSVYFPIEAHTGIPFWWILPKWLKDRLHRRWSVILPDWNQMVLGTVVVKKKVLKSYFFDGMIKTEKLFGIPKSYYVYRKLKRET